MTVGVANHPFLDRTAPRQETIMPALILVGALAIYVTLRTTLLAVADGTARDCLTLDVVTIGVALLCVRLRYADIVPLLRPLLRGIGAVVLVQVVFDATTLLYGPAPMLSGANGLFFRIGGGLAIASGLVAFWRPSFALPLFFHYVAFRHQLNYVSGVAVSETDYLSMLDIGQFIGIGALFATAVTQPRFAARYLPAGTDAVRLRNTACALIWAWAVGAHLGNYFISGWTKIQAGGNEPWFWLLHNPTQTSILIGLERGDNPLAAWPALVQASWDTIVKAGVFLNLFVLGVQIAAPMALVRRRWLMTFTILFDLFHVAVYLTLGAFFFFWIAVNVLIYMSAKRLDDRAFTPAMQGVAVLSLLMAHFVFYTSHLGWLDGAKLASPSFVAETRDGRTVPVPSVYFGIMSYSIAQTAMYIPDDHFPMRLGGNTYNRTDWQDAQSCGPQVLHRQNTGVGLQTVEAMVLNNDAAMRRHPAVKADNLYYLYPHHMVANPAVFGDFNRLSIDDIVGYRYVVDSVCLSLRDGRLVRDVRKTTEYPIDVRP